MSEREEKLFEEESEGHFPEDERHKASGPFNFLRDSWAELQRVQWPDRRQVGQATAVVLGFVVVAGGYLGLLDAAFQKIVEAIL